MDFRICVSLDCRNLLGDSESVFLYAVSLDNEIIVNAILMKLRAESAKSKHM